MNKKDEALKLALEALENNLEVMKADWDQIDQEWGPSEGGLQAALDGTLTGYGYFKDTISAITAIREALAEQPEQVCDHCNHPLYAGTKCKNCGRVSEQPSQKEFECPRCGHCCPTQQQEPVAWADECRIELVNAIHFLASDFENALGAFHGDTEARRKAEGDIAHARSITSRWNWNGTTKPASKPLTDEEIKKIWGSYFSRGIEFARAIEAAHGIKGDAA